MGVIYLVRHGQAHAQAYGSSASAPETVGLTALGREQARRTGAALAARIGPVTAAVSGDLARQRETLDVILGEIDAGPAPHRDPRWNEYDIAAVLGGGDLAVSTAGRSLQRILDAALQDWATQPATETGDLDGFGAYRQRCGAALADIRQLAGPGQTVLAVSSSGTITRILADLWGMNAEAWIAMSRTMINASITKLIVGSTGISAVSVNEHAHLDAPDHTGERATLTYR